MGVGGGREGRSVKTSISWTSNTGSMCQTPLQSRPDDKDDDLDQIQMKIQIEIFLGLQTEDPCVRHLTPKT